MGNKQITHHDEIYFIQPTKPSVIEKYDKNFQWIKNYPLPSFHHFRYAKIIDDNFVIIMSNTWYLLILVLEANHLYPIFERRYEFDDLIGKCDIQQIDKTIRVYIIASNNKSIYMLDLKDPDHLHRFPVNIERFHQHCLFTVNQLSYVSSHDGIFYKNHILDDKIQEINLDWLPKDRNYVKMIQMSDKNNKPRMLATMFTTSSYNFEDCEKIRIITVGGGFQDLQISKYPAENFVTYDPYEDMILVLETTKTYETNGLSLHFWQEIEDRWTKIRSETYAEEGYYDRKKDVYSHYKNNILCTPEHIVIRYVSTKLIDRITLREIKEIPIPQDAWLFVRSDWKEELYNLMLTLPVLSKFSRDIIKILLSYMP